jgi:hypothetical protein
MSESNKKRGPEPEILKVPLPFAEAVKAALETNPPPPEKPKKKRRRRSVKTGPTDRSDPNK